MSAFLYSQPEAIRQLIKKVTVYEDKYAMEFKSGVTMNVGNKA